MTNVPEEEGLTNNSVVGVVDPEERHQAGHELLLLPNYDDNSAADAEVAQANHKAQQEQQQQHSEEKDEMPKEEEEAAAAQKEEEEKSNIEILVDEEGLRKQGYDVILCGTSLVQSILASALARAGKTVLHCDVGDYYGELDAVWTLPYLESLYQQQQQEQQKQQQDANTLIPKDDDDDNRTDSTSSCNSSILSLSSRGGLQGFHIHSMSRKEDEDFFFSVESECDYVGVLVMTPYGKGRIDMNQQKATKTTMSLAVSLTDWKLTNGSFPTLHVGIPSSLLQGVDDVANKEEEENNTQHAEQTTTTTILQELLKKKNRNRNQYLVKEAKIIIPHQAILARDILEKRSRSIALDMSPGLLYAHGPAAQGLLTSKVADYIEFKSLQGLWWYYSCNHDNGTSSKRAKAAAANAQQRQRLEMVPCSKNDVFTSTLLTPMEKRRLMKFLQLALDYATAQEAAAEAAASALQQEQQGGGGVGVADNNNDNLAIVQSLNERHLNQGRSLARPQNKAVNTSDMETLQECILANNNNNNNSPASGGNGGGENGMDFDTYLQEKHSLSPKLRSLVRYALALEVMGSSSSSNSNSIENMSSRKNNKPLMVEEGMKRLCRHMQALGRFGSTAFLIPMYGSGELSQAFCRSAAVYGATYILRRCMRGVVVVDAITDKKLDDSASSMHQYQQQQTTGVLISQPTRDDDVPSSTATLPSSLSLRDLKQIPCQHVVIPESALLRHDNNQQGGGGGGGHLHHVKVPRRRVLRRISIVQGKPKVLLSFKSKSEDKDSHSRQCRHAIILPPGSLDGDENDTGLYSSCPQSYTIQGLVLDESVNVAPHNVAPDGCCIVHLSTLVDVDDGSTNSTHDGRDGVNDDPTGVTEAQTLLLKKALDTIILADDDDASTVQEIFHCSFSFPLYDDDDDVRNNDNRQNKEERIKGLHVVRRPPPSLTVDPDFEQARVIFNRICPGADFLTLSKEIETAVKERFGDAVCNPNDADDDEKLVLESAMGMISGNDAASNTAGSANAGLPFFIWLGHCRRPEEEDAVGLAKSRRAYNLLLPVPAPSEPNVTIVEVQEQSTTSEPTTSEQVLKLIQNHYSMQGAPGDHRIYFASSWKGDDVMDHATLIKESIVAVKEAGLSHFSYHVFTSGLVTPSAKIDIGDIGIDCFHVSLFAGSKAEYEESTGREAKVDGIEEEVFSKVCGFISDAVQHNIAVEASVLKRYEETGRVLARSLGAREIHVFDK